MTVRWRVKSRVGNGKITTHSHLYERWLDANRHADTLSIKDPSRKTKAWVVKVNYRDKPPKVTNPTLAQRFPPETPLPKPKPKSAWL